MAESKNQSTKQIADNRKAYHEYFVLEKFEWIELCGTEVKGIRNGSVNLKDAWCSIEDGECFVKGMHISPYEKGNIFNRDPRRERRLYCISRKFIGCLAEFSRRGLR